MTAAGERAPLVRVTHHLTEVDQRQWDRLADSFYLSTQWLRLVERMPSQVRPAYVTVSGADGRMICAAPCYERDGESNNRYDVTHVLAGLVGRWPRDCLVGGARRGYVNSCLVDTELSVTERRRVVGQVVDAVADRASRAGDDAVTWMYLPTGPAADLAAATRTRPVLTGADTMLVLPGTTMADYWASYRPGRRSRARREATVFARSSYTTAVERLGDCYGEAGPLLGQVERKYGRPADDHAMIASLARQAEHVDDCSRVFTCRRDGRLVGFALFYAWRDGLYARLVGFDYPRLRSQYEYFNLLFYEPVRHAYDHGARFLHLGIESTATKCLRGATARPLWTILSSRTWSMPSAGEITAWNQRGLREWTRCQEEVGAAVSPEWGNDPWVN